MSLLTIAQAVLGEVVGHEPSSVAGNNDSMTKQVLRLINREGKILARMKWTIMQKEHTFNTVNGTASYDLPSDFGYLLENTAWDRTNYWAMRGNQTPAEWQIYKSAIIANQATRKRFRIKASDNVRKFFIDPTPSAAEALVFEYVRTTWCTDSAGTTFRSAMTANDDVALVPEDIIELGAIWRFRKAKGLDYSEDFNTYQKELNKAFAQDQAIGTLDMGQTRNIEPWRLNLPETGFGS